MSDIPEFAHTSLLNVTAIVLKDLGIRYFITGSQTTILYGEPRFTNDVDVVVDLSAEQIPQFLKAFERDAFYLSETVVRSGVQRRGMFNLIDAAKSSLRVNSLPQLSLPDIESAELQKQISLQSHGARL